MRKKLYDQFLCSCLMLPEHVEKLQQHAKELRQKKLQNMPEFDDQKYELWERLLQESLLEKKNIIISYLGHNGPVTVTGVIASVNLQLRRVYVATLDTAQNISMDKVTYINYE